MACSSDPSSPATDNGGGTGGAPPGGGGAGPGAGGATSSTGGAGPGAGGAAAGMYTAKDAVIVGTVTQCTGTTPVTLPQDISVPGCTLPTCKHAACISAAQVQQYAPYTLTVNGVLQPGGAPLS